MSQAIEGGLYRHFRGTNYRVLHLAKNASTGGDAVVYQDVSGGEVYVRDRAQFEEQVPLGGKMIDRFTLAEG